MMQSIRSFILVGAAVVLASSAAQAQSTNVFTFQTDQASLRTDAGVRETYSRLIAQTAHYCEQLALGVMTQQCETEVLSAAIAQVGSPGLTARHTEYLAEQARNRQSTAATPTS